MTKRYFDEAKSKPGVISEELRNALGLSKRSLPIWIHRMRILGYPPGWLKKADMSDTTMDFIDGTEKTGDDLEDGQILMDSLMKEKTYNPDSFFEYPGFNSPVPNGVKDDFEKLGMPPMQEFQQLKFAKQSIQVVKPKPYKRMKSSHKSDDKSDESVKSDKTVKTDKESDKELSDVEKKEDDNASIVLDTSQDEEPENAGHLTELKEKQKETADSEIVQAEIEESDSDDSNDKIILDAEKRNLIACSLKEKNVDENRTSTVPDLKLNDKSLDQNETEIKNNKADQSYQDDSIGDNQNADHTAVDEADEDRTSRESTGSKLTLVSMGAPVPSSLNGQKPPLENFSVGMGELVYFENLPTSTGVFDKLRKVLKKIRKKIT